MIYSLDCIHKKMLIGKPVSKRVADKGYNISISFQRASFTADAHENSVLHGKESLKTL